MNDDPKWDELIAYLSQVAFAWNAEVEDVTELIFPLGPQVEADEWPSVIGDTE